MLLQVLRLLNRFIDVVLLLRLSPGPSRLLSWDYLHLLLLFYFNFFLVFGALLRLLPCSGSCQVLLLPVAPLKVPALDDRVLLLLAFVDLAQL